jgi:hypothetical protein
LNLQECVSVNRYKNTWVLNYLKRARKNKPDYNSREFGEGEIVLEEAECGNFLDAVWDDKDILNFHKQSAKVQFKNDVQIKTGIEYKGSYNLLSMDYSEYGDFYPLTLDFRYIAFYEKGLIVKLPEDKESIFVNIFNFKNTGSIVFFRIDEKDKKHFYKNFVERYKKTLDISMDRDVEMEINTSSLYQEPILMSPQKGLFLK